MVILAIIGVVVIGLVVYVLLVLDGQQQDHLSQALQTIEQSRQETIRELMEAARESGAFRDRIE